MSVTRRSLCRMDGSFRRDADTGYLIATVQPTRAGVFLYQDASGNIVRELRPRHEVFDIASLESLQNKPITNSHPPEFLNVANTDKYQVGTVTGLHNEAEDGLHTVAGAQVTHMDAIADVEKGKQQVSCGYKCDIDNTPGTDPEFGEYDRAQKNIRYNHLAIEWRGRAGSGARLRTDNESQQLRFDAWEIQSETEKMEAQNVSNESSVKLDALQEQGRVDAVEIANLKTELAQVKLDKADADKSIETLQGRIDALVIELEEAKKIDVDAAVNARLALIEKARPHLAENFKFDGVSDDEIKGAVLTAKYDSVNLEGVSSERIDGMFEVATLEVKEQNRTDGGKQVQSVYAGAERKDVNPIEAAYNRSLEKMTGENK